MGEGPADEGVSSRVGVMWDTRRLHGEESLCENTPVWCAEDISVKKSVIQKTRSHPHSS